jgi:hypothetical protein
VSIDDRIRNATEATAATVREIRPLALPDHLPATAPPARPRRRRALGWGNFLIPLSAAVAVIAVAAALVAVRDLPGEHRTSASGTPNPSSGAPTPPVGDGVPRYYVTLAHPSGQPNARQQAVVSDDHTTLFVAVVPPPPGESFTGVTAAADDRTFVLSSYQSATRQTIWYLLRITPGAADPARLTRLPIKPLAAQPAGLALSPDGRELAVMFADADIELRTYSVSTGALLGTWHTGTPYWTPRTGGANAYGLSWLADGRHLEFRFDAYARNSSTHLVTVRTLDVTAAGHDLLAGSRLVLQTPLAVTSPTPAEPCAASLAAPDGRTVICGVQRIPDQQSKASCTTTVTSSPSFVSYSTATGKPLKVLQRDGGQCWTDLPLWTNSSGSQVICLMAVSPTSTRVEIDVYGLIAAGHFTMLGAEVDEPSLQAATDPGSTAF